MAKSVTVSLFDGEYLLEVPYSVDISNKGRTVIIGSKIQPFLLSLTENILPDEAVKMALQAAENVWLENLVSKEQLIEYFRNKGAVIWKNPEFK